MSYWDGVDAADQGLPRIEREFAQIYQSKPRYVMSRSHPQLDEKSTLVTGDVVVRVRELKNEGEGYLGLGVGPELLALFLENKFIDELHVITKPMLLAKASRCSAKSRVTSPRASLNPNFRWRLSPPRLHRHIPPGPGTVSGSPSHKRGGVRGGSVP